MPKTRLEPWNSSTGQSVSLNEGIALRGNGVGFWGRPTPLRALISGDFRNVTSQAFRTLHGDFNSLQPSYRGAMDVETPGDIGLRLASL
jgi:hypothetical protein